MAKPNAPSAPPPEAAPESLYPVVESFVEQASPEELADFFLSVREGLSALKGPRAEQGKKVEAALRRAEELLSHLLEVRERLAADQKGGHKSRK